MRVLDQQHINLNLVAAENAVRGKLFLTACEIEKAIATAHAANQPSPYPFDHVVYCNIGNPQICGQVPLTYIRQTLALVECPSLFSLSKVFPPDIIKRAQRLIEATGSPGTTGAYSHSAGVPFVRKSIASFIERRDGVPASSDDVFLTDGASAGIKYVLNMMISHQLHGVMIPVPQYPLYHAVITQLGGTKVSYDLDEERNWAIDMRSVKEAWRKATAHGVSIKGFVVINPGNPTGHVLTEENMKEVLRFCYQHHICLLADEVYQENVFDSATPFRSFRKVLLSMEKDIREGVELVSFFSVSKGYYGECGKRGGYVHMQNIDEFAKQQLYKLLSVTLCSNVVGQIAMELVVNPPQEGDASYTTFVAEKKAICDGLKQKAAVLQSVLSECDGITCTTAQGALYLFPRVTFPQRFLDECEKQEKEPDETYAIQMLTSTGVCVVPGAGFGQKEGTHHFRIAFLPPVEDIQGVAERIKTFHQEFMHKYEC